MAIFSSSEITNPAQEKRIFFSRLKFISIIMLVSFLLVLVRVGYLQIISYEEQISRADDYHKRVRAVAPERGLIYDAKGNLLAGNRLSHSLFIHPLKVEDVDELLTSVAALIEMDPEYLADFRERLLSVRRVNQLLLLREQLTEEEISRLMVNRHKLAGMEIQRQYQRFYPQGELFSHVVGHTGRISPEDLEQIDKVAYRGLDSIGKLGLEKFYEPYLKGQQGFEEVGVNAYGRVVELYNDKQPVKGENLELWLDRDLQEIAWEVLGDKNGAVVVLDAQTGGIMTMVSKPSYDNNQFVSGIKHREFAKLRQNQGAPLLNRVTSGRYPPGSTIKPFYAIEALENEVVTPDWTITDRGYFQLPNSSLVFRNWKRSGHGQVNISRAITISSDTYFYNLAFRNGIERMRHGLQKFCFGQRCSLDSYEELALQLPGDEWKRQVHEEAWYPGDTINMGIGQGYFVASPLQLATATMILANRGRYVQPHLVKSLGGKPIYPQQMKAVVNATNENWDLVIESMRKVLSGSEGTARRAGWQLPYAMAGKTGTSQVVSLRLVEELEDQNRTIRDEWKDHALFVGFVPIAEPQYAFTVVLEHGGSGSAAAVLARQLTDYLMLQHNKLTAVSEEGG